MTADRFGDWQDLLSLQHGVIARWQAARAKLDVTAIDVQLRRHRWQALYSGVYGAFTGEPSRIAVLWAAVLRAGPDALLSHHTAAELDRLSDKPREAVHVTISAPRRVCVTAGECENALPRIIVHRLARIDDVRHPSRTPPRTRVEETTLDLAQTSANAHEAISWLIRACSRRLTTDALLLAAIDARRKLRWRNELAAALNDAGIHSSLEWRYVRDVERRHGLPIAQRQAVSRAGIRTRHLDNLYREFGVAVELDGRAAHPAEARWRDIHRDNASAAVGIITLRYNWADITMDPCRVANEIACVLRSRGWKGQLRPCGPDCRICAS